MSKFFYLRFIINKSNMIKIVSGKERDNSIDAVAGIMILYTILMHLGATNEFGEFVDSLHYVFLAQFKFSVASSRGANQRWCIHDTGRTGCPQCHAAVL